MHFRAFSSMPHYSFTLRDGVSVRDVGDEHLRDDEAARAVAREMRQAFATHALSTRFHIVVENEVGTIICDLPLGSQSKPDATKA